MKQFITFIFFIFAALFGVYFYRDGRMATDVVRVYAPSSFVSRWGAGPLIKEAFEKECSCKLEWNDSGDLQLFLKRMRLESNQVGADLVLGIDLLDEEKAHAQFEWKAIEAEANEYFDEVLPIRVKNHFAAYDWGVLTMLVRKSENPQLPVSVEDFLNAKWKEKISLPDPRTSTSGFNFLLWLIQLKGEDSAFQFLNQLEPQIISYSPNWSSAYGLFTKGVATAAYSYTTSPLYHQIEEKSEDVIALQLSEPSLMQVEYMGIPVTCKSCDLAERLAKFILSPGGQKIIMEKNYMFPVEKSVVLGTPFAQIPKYQVFAQTHVPSPEDKERLLKRWAEQRGKN